MLAAWAWLNRPDPAACRDAGLPAALHRAACRLLHREGQLSPIIPPSCPCPDPAACSFQRDGLLLLHKEGQYWPGQTPLALLWKDAGSSRYFIDTDPAGKAPVAGAASAPRLAGLAATLPGRHQGMCGLRAAQAWPPLHAGRIRPACAAIALVANGEAPAGPAGQLRNPALAHHREPACCRAWTPSHPSGVSPLSPFFFFCFPFFFAAPAAGVPLAQQQVVLEFRMDSTVATHDDAPVVLGRMPESFVRQLG